jgi:uncharacterized membrane protein
MEFKIKFNNKEKRFFVKALWIIISLYIIWIGVLAICYLESIGLIKPTQQIRVLALALHGTICVVVIRTIHNYLFEKNINNIKINNNEQ